MGAPARSYHQQRQDKCLHQLKQLDPDKNDGFRYRCIKPDCGKWLYRKNGVVVESLQGEAILGNSTRQSH